MWKNSVEPGRPQMAIWRMRFPCLLTKATDTHSEYVILIAFPWQKWLARRRLYVTLRVHCRSCYGWCCEELKQVRHLSLQQLSLAAVKFCLSNSLQTAWWRLVDSRNM